jgi:nucleotidyltransferase/DNA polymerase involved in DNA repair
MDTASLPEVGCLLIPAFPLACELSDRPELTNLPVVVATPGAPTVMVASSAAVAQGVNRGQRLRHALGLCPTLTVLDSRPAHYQRISEQLLNALECVVPAVEWGDDGVIYLDLHGLQRRYVDLKPLADDIFVSIDRAFSPQLGLASQKFPALVAAHATQPRTALWVKDEDVHTFLRAQTVECLPASADLLGRLRLFGFTSLANITEIPQRKFTAEFGPEGEFIWLLASGRMKQPVNRRNIQPVISEELCFEEPVVTRDFLELAVTQLINRIVLGQKFRGRASRQATVRMITELSEVWAKTVTFKEAISDLKELNRILVSCLSQLQSIGPVVSVAITLSEITNASGWQKNLPTARDGDNERLQEGLRQLRARYGSTNVFRAVAVETWSQFPEDQCALLEHNP